MNDRTAWLEERRKGIGASDIAAIAGLSPVYWENGQPRRRTAVDVWKSKVEPVEDEEMSVAASLGLACEELAAKEWSRCTGLIPQRVAPILTHPQHSFMRASLDFALFDAGDITPLECKTSFNVNGAANWDNGIPDYYQAQGQWQMGVTGAKVCYFAVLLGGFQTEFRHYILERDDALIEQLITIGAAFWEYVKAGTPPPATQWHDVATIYPISTAKEVEATEEVARSAWRMQEIKGQIKALEAEFDTLATSVMSHLGEADTLTWASEKLCTYRTQQTRRLDTTAIKEKEPAIADKYTKVTNSRVLRFPRGM